MAALKCKMCGGDLVITPGSTVCECEYCGSKQTIPAADNEKKLTLFARANRLRFNSEFDKAAGVYESIVADFSEEAEAYWGLVLCKYGIEYVDDPATAKKVPTCHRSSFDSVLDDQNFDMACEYAEPEAKRLYREEAKAIETIRKGIIEVSGKEDPYDIFICYKETADDGNRTLDSVLAQDIYTALTEKGYRVFFSRITLEDKLGQEYEPYIFAALHSARIMLAVGTQFEYYDAVWVKNEWSRYLKLIEAGEKKTLIPCYKNLDPYDMPKEFAKLQAQDLGKVGATQDLLRGIEKILGKNEPQKIEKNSDYSVIQQIVSNGPSINVLLERGNDALEDGAFDEAKTFFNSALNVDAHSAKAYLGLFMAENNFADADHAKSAFVKGNYTDDRYWKRARQYATDEFSDELSIWEVLRNKRLERDAENARKKAEEERLRRQKEEERARISEEQKRIQKQREAEKSTLREEQMTLIRAQLKSGIFELTDNEKNEQEHLKADAKAAEEATLEAQKTLMATAEMQEINRLEQEIISKKAKMEGLGLFKAKEKKELQAQIDTILISLKEKKKEIEATEAYKRYANLKKKSDALKVQADNYIHDLPNARIRMLKKLICEKKKIKISDQIIKFGQYKQKGNYPEAIEWQVLERKEKAILLISKYCIEAKPYHDNTRFVSWEECAIRHWLNSDFLDAAFDKDEQYLIMDILWPEDPSHSIKDKLFLLSIDEVQKYFPEDMSQQCKATNYANSQGALVDKTNGNSSWWLRQKGSKRSGAFPLVTTKGGIIFGSVYGNNFTCVRPALWISLE